MLHPKVSETPCEESLSQSLSQYNAVVLMNKVGTSSTAVINHHFFSTCGKVDGRLVPLIPTKSLHAGQFEGAAEEYA